MKTKTKLPAEKWLLSATGNKKARPYLQHVHAGKIASNGFALHYSPNEEAPACNCEHCAKNGAFDQVLGQARRQRKEMTITTAALILSCKQALAIGKDPEKPKRDITPMLRITANGKLSYFAENDGVGTVSGEWEPQEWETTRDLGFPVVSTYRQYSTRWYKVKVEYTHEGEDIYFGVNPKFLLNALLGMGETITLKCNAKNAPIYITDGEREAVVMPMHLG